ncbi:MAG: hypothetical protein FJY91_00020 [Candidatus Harrisonbacteria bacterium]|nr:hypothetical protein [Candidatus Harrisonbacteria bacterium]
MDVMKEFKIKSLDNGAQIWNLREEPNTPVLVFPNMASSPLFLKDFSEAADQAFMREDWGRSLGFRVINFLNTTQGLLQNVLIAVMLPAEKFFLFSDRNQETEIYVDEKGYSVNFRQVQPIFDSQDPVVRMFRFQPQMTFRRLIRMIRVAQEATMDSRRDLPLALDLELIPKRHKGLLALGKTMKSREMSLRVRTYNLHGSGFHPGWSSQFQKIADVEMEDKKERKLFLPSGEFFSESWADWKRFDLLE